MTCASRAVNSTGRVLDVPADCRYTFGMRGAAWVLAIAVVGGGTVAWLVHARTGAVDRELNAELAAALDRGGIGDLG